MLRKLYRFHSHAIVLSSSKGNGGRNVILSQRGGTQKGKENYRISFIFSFLHRFTNGSKNNGLTDFFFFQGHRTIIIFLAKIVLFNSQSRSHGPPPWCTARAACFWRNSHMTHRMFSSLSLLKCASSEELPPNSLLFHTVLAPTLCHLITIPT